MFITGSGAKMRVVTSAVFHFSFSTKVQPRDDIKVRAAAMRFPRSDADGGAAACLLGGVSHARTSLVY